MCAGFIWRTTRAQLSKLAYFTKLSVRPIGFMSISLRNHIPKMLHFLDGVRTHLMPLVWLCHSPDLLAEF